MIKSHYSAMSLAGMLLIGMAAVLPTTSYAKEGYRDSGSVRAEHRDRDGNHARDGRRNRGGYDHRDRDSHGYRHHRPQGHAYGYYDRPRYPTTYIVVPRYRSYTAPRYYDGGRSGWDVDLHYYFSD